MLDVSDPITERPIRSPLDVVIRAFAISRDQRFELELQHVPDDIELVVLPPPVDDRDFFDFTGGKELIDEAYRSPPPPSTTSRPARAVQRRRRWWQRFGDWADLLQQERRTLRANVMNVPGRTPMTSVMPAATNSTIPLHRSTGRDWASALVGGLVGRRAG